MAKKARATTKAIIIAIASPRKIRGGKIAKKNIKNNYNLAID